MKVRFRNGYIAVGGFPSEIYYRQDPRLARVRIENPTGTAADVRSAIREMRGILKDPSWITPEGYVWNHAGPPGSRIMELVRKAPHAAIAHKSYAAGLRALRRSVRTQGATSRGFLLVDIYLTVRTVLQENGILQPDYVVDRRMIYQFEISDGSVFIVWSGGLFSTPKIEFVDGTRKGQTRAISQQEMLDYQREAEKVWGRYVPGSLFREPRFIPGTNRDKLPYFKNEYGVPYEAGWIDEDGVHLDPFRGPSRT